MFKKFIFLYLIFAVLFSLFYLPLNKFDLIVDKGVPHKYVSGNFHGNISQISIVQLTSGRLLAQYYGYEIDYEKYFFYLLISAIAFGIIPAGYYAFKRQKVDK